MSLREKRKNILVFNNGTYGDGAILETVLKELKAFLNAKNNQNNYNVIYVTNKASILPDGTQPKHIFDFPEFVLNDPLLGPADSSQSLFDFVLNNAFYVKSIADWSYSTVKVLKDLYEKYNPVGVIYNFSLLPAIFRADHEFPNMLRTKQIPTFVFYYAPGIPNQVTPWIYDGRLRKRNFQLYAPKHMSNASESWETIMSRSTIKPALSSFFNKDVRVESAVDLLGSLYHLLAWPPSLVPPIIPANDDMRLIPVSYNMFTQNPQKRPGVTPKEDKGRKLPQEVLRFVQTHQQRKPLIFMSFGSFVKIPHFRALIPYLVHELVQTHAVIVHKTWKNNDNDEDICPSASRQKDCYVHEGFIDYDKIIPDMTIVMGSGSYGLQTVCLKHQKPMIMVPIITEQYFWAKNFQYFTGVYYIDIADVYNEKINVQVKKALNSVYARKSYQKSLPNSNSNTEGVTIKPRVTTFLKQISQEMYTRQKFQLAENVMRKIK